MTNFNLFFFVVISGVRCGFGAGLLEVSPHSLLRVHGCACSSSLPSTILSVLLSSLPWTTKPFGLMKYAIRIAFGDIIVHRCLGAMQYSSNVPFGVSFSI